MWNLRIEKVGPPPSQRSTTCIHRTVIPMLSYYLYFPDVDYFIRKLSLSKTPSKIQQNKWLWIQVKHLVVRPSQQADQHCEINRLVPNMPFSLLNHTIYWLVTVMLWFSNVKPDHYKGGSASFAVVNNFSTQNGYFDACLLTLFELWFF